MKRSIILLLATSLLLAACGPAQPTATSLPDFPSNPAPVVVARVADEGNKTFIYSTDLSGGIEVAPVEIPKGYRLMAPPEVTRNAVLFVAGNGVNRLVMTRAAPGRAPESITLEVDLSGGSPRFVDGYLLAVPTDADTLTLVSPELVRTDLAWKSEAGNDGRLSISGVVGRQDGTLAAFSANPVRKDGKGFAAVWVIDPKAGSIDENLLRLPEYVENLYPGSGAVDTKYSVTVLGISEALTEVYYQYNTLKASDSKEIYTAYAVWSAAEQRDLAVKKDYSAPRFPAQAGNVLYEDKSSLDGGGRIVNLSDLTPLFDIGEYVKLTPESRAMIRPYGVNWLIGSETHVYVVSAGGELLADYALPADFSGGDYELGSSYPGE